jgi:chromosome segregation ATPase
MECEQTMTDNAEIVRGHIAEWAYGLGLHGEMEALAALDALVVERDEARAAYQREVEAFRALGGSNLMQAIARAEAAEAERDKANDDWSRMRDLHSAAIEDLRGVVAERDEARQANAEKRELLTKTALRISQLEAERGEARRERDAARTANESLLANYYDERNRAEAAEAEVARLREALGWVDANTTDVQARTTARAALAPKEDA